MESIRVRFASIILYISRTLSFITGAIFVLMLSRSLGLNIGLFQLIMSLINFSFTFTVISSFWSVRYSARGYNVLKEALLAHLVAVLLGMISYLMLVFFNAKLLLSNINYLVLGLIYVFVLFYSDLITRLAFSRRPEAIGYSLLIFELSKLVLVTYFYIYRLITVTLALIILLISRLLQLLIILIKYKKIFVIGEKISRGTWKLWIKNGWLPLFGTISAYLILLDASIVNFFSGYIESIAFFSISLSIAGLTTQYVSVASVIYPKLLRGGGEDDISLILKLSFMFIIPLSIVVIYASDIILSFFGNEFTKASQIAKILVFAEIFSVIEFVINSSITGLEKVDLRIDINHKDLIKSNLFKYYNIDLATKFLYLTLLATVIILVGRGATPLSIALYWSLIYTFVKIITTLVKYLFCSRIGIKIKIPIKSIMTYLFASLVASFVLFFVPDIPMKSRLLTLISIYSPYFIIYGSIYLILIVFLDEEARYLAKRILQSIIKSI